MTTQLAIEHQPLQDLLATQARSILTGLDGVLITECMGIPVPGAIPGWREFLPTA